MNASLTLVERKALRKLKRQLTTKHPSVVKAIYLYGSKARGDASAASDVDVLVVVERGAKRLVQTTVAEIVSSLVCSGAPYLSVLVQDSERWLWDTPFTQSVRRDAVAL